MAYAEKGKCSGKFSRIGFDCLYDLVGEQYAWCSFCSADVIVLASGMYGTK